MKSFILLYLKGLVMGAADIVPGVSGGTIALITGIYERLINAIRSVNLEALQLLLKFEIKSFWKHVDGTFLLILLAGIGTSAVTFSRIIPYLLTYYPEMLWAFFFGLILASIYVVSNELKTWNITIAIVGIVGVIVAYFITELTPISTPESYWFIFISGMIAICAMILPGISGSFLLIILGKYTFIIESLKGFKMDIIAVFGLGCITGILSFSHVLNWLLKKYHDIAIALLTGFMVGALNKVWPWKQTLETYLDRHGELKPLATKNVYPWEYTAATGKDAGLIYCLLLGILGFGLVFLIDKFTNSKAKV